MRVAASGAASRAEGRFGKPRGAALLAGAGGRSGPQQQLRRSESRPSSRAAPRAPCVRVCAAVRGCLPPFFFQLPAASTPRRSPHTASYGQDGGSGRLWRARLQPRGVGERGVRGPARRRRRRRRRRRARGPPLRAGDAAAAARRGAGGGAAGDVGARDAPHPVCGAGGAAAAGASLAGGGPALAAPRARARAPGGALRRLRSALHDDARHTHAGAGPRRRTGSSWSGGRACVPTPVPPPLR